MESKGGAKFTSGILMQQSKNGVVIDARRGGRVGGDPVGGLTAHLFVFQPDDLGMCARRVQEPVMSTTFCPEGVTGNARKGGWAEAFAAKGPGDFFLLKNVDGPPPIARRGVKDKTKQAGER